MTFTAANANLILQQLTESNNAIGVLKCFVGATNIAFCSKNQYVSFHLKAKGNKINGKQPRYVRITLTPADTYTMEFGTDKRYKNEYGSFSQEYMPLKTIENLYFDMLKKTFEEETGLYLSFN